MKTTIGIRVTGRTTPSFLISHSRSSKRINLARIGRLAPSIHTLFRISSASRQGRNSHYRQRNRRILPHFTDSILRLTRSRIFSHYKPIHTINSRNWTILRSEEHTSELQSHVNLVCRLLLEKK